MPWDKAGHLENVSDNQRLWEIKFHQHFEADGVTPKGEYRAFLQAERRGDKRAMAELFKRLQKKTVEDGLEVFEYFAGKDECLRSSFERMHVGNGTEAGEKARNAFARVLKNSNPNLVGKSKTLLKALSSPVFRKGLEKAMTAVGVAGLIYSGYRWGTDPVGALSSDMGIGRDSARVLFDGIMKGDLSVLDRLGIDLVRDGDIVPFADLKIPGRATPFRLLEGESIWRKCYKDGKLVSEYPIQITQIRKKANGAYDLYYGQEGKERIEDVTELPWQ